VKKTEDGIQCTECNWTGLETDCIKHDLPGDSWFECPVCGAECAHYPLDELDEEC
jgi:hypothetical protein